MTPAVMIETIAIIVVLSISVLSLLVVWCHASRVRVAAAMYTVARMLKI